LINTIDHIINIDLASKINMNQSISIKKNDTNSHKFIINIFNNSVAYDLTSSTSRIYFKKADGNKVFLDCILDSTTVNKLSVLLTTQALTYAGLVASEITIYGTSGEILTSVTFNFTVSDVIRDDVAIESVSEFTALTDALAVVTTIANKADKTYVDTNLDIVNTQLAETAQQSNTNATQITSLASGSPKGTYTTLALLQSAYPTGDTNIYLVTFDGNWYYWNNSNWVSGGLYQSTEWLDVITVQNQTWGVV